jgi:nucleoid-associated protein YgaU
MLVICGCGFKNGNECSHPFFIRAEKARNANEMELAVKYYKRYLSVNPESSKTHLLVASIYDENLDKPLFAVYHYVRFLELAPRSPEAENVQKWLAAAQKKYYNRTRLKYNDPEDVGVLQNTLFTTERELKKYKQEVEKLKSLQKRLAVYARKLRDSEQKQEKELKKLRGEHEKTLKNMVKLKKELADIREDIRNKQKNSEDKVADADKAEASEKAKKEIKEVGIQEGEKSQKEIKEDKNSGEGKTVKKDNAVAEKTKAESEVKVKVKKEVVPGKNASVPDKSDIPEKSMVPEAEATPAAAKAKAAEKELEAPAFMLTRGSVELKPGQRVKKDAGNQFYTVKKGDSLSAISRQFYGASRYYKLIFDANRDILASETSLLPGQVLKIPVRKKE